MNGLTKFGYRVFQKSMWVAMWFLPWHQNKGTLSGAGSIKGINVEISEIGDNFFVFRFTCQPQGIGFAHMIHGLPQTEGAGTGTFVGQIDVKIIVNFIKNRHSKNSFVSI